MHMIHAYDSKISYSNDSSYSQRCYLLTGPHVYIVRYDINEYVFDIWQYVALINVDYC